MKKVFFWFFAIGLSVSFPHLILAQNVDNSDREKIIAQQMNCVENHLADNKSIGWDDLCVIPDTKSQNTASQVLAATGQGGNDPNSLSDDQDDQINKSLSTVKTDLRPFDPISTRIMSDPLYQPLKRQLYGETSYTYSRDTYKLLYGSPLVPTFSYKDTYNTFTQELAYGITDDFSLYFTDATGYDQSNQTNISTGDEIRRVNRGVYNPDFDLTYRVLDQVKYPVDANLYFFYSPNTFPSKYGDPAYKGSVAPGRQSYGFTAAVGREMKSFTIRAYTTLTSLGALSYEYDGLSTSYYRYKPTWEYTYGLETQTRLTENFSVNLSMGYTFVNNLNETDFSSALSWIEVPSNTLFFSTALNYNFIPNTLIGGLTYEYNDYSDSKALYANTSFNSETKQDQANIFGFRLQYLFM